MDNVLAGEIPVPQHQRVHRGEKSDCQACLGRNWKGLSTALRAPTPLAAVSVNSLNRPRERRTTHFGCAQCGVALCTDDKCWYLWHSDN
jgi:hypothetical protein